MKVKFIISGAIFPDVTAAFASFMAENSKKDICMDITTFGGSIFAASEIVAMIKAHPKKVDAEINSYCMSAGTYITSAILAKGGKVVMSANAQMMIHKPETSAEGNIDELNSYAKMLQNITDDYLSVYSAAMGKTIEEVNTMLARDSWFTAQEALALGLISEISTAVDLKEDVVALLKNYGRTVALNTQTIENMKYPLITAVLQLDENSDEKSVVKAINDLNTRFATVSAEKTSLETEKADLTQKLADVNAQVLVEQKAKVTALIEGAVKANKIKEIDKPRYEKLANMDYETTAEVLAGIAPYKSVAAGVSAANANSEFEGKTYEDLHKSGGLVKLKKADPNAFEALKARYLAQKGE